MKQPENKNWKKRIVPIKDGVVMIGSDVHIWPGELSTSQVAFIELAKKLHPTIVIMNGDVLDGASISRFPPIEWENHPLVQDEIDAAKRYLHMVAKATQKAAHFWTLGNHDARFETRLASVAPEYKGVHGIHLKDHFPAWTPAWSVRLGGPRGVVVKHRFNGGIHASRNNALKSGRSIITGHLHALNVTAITDLNGTRWGVDGGMMADPHGPQFRGYTEENSTDWREGFVVLTFHNGELMWPEVVNVLEDGVVQFRGERIKV